MDKIFYTITQAVEATGLGRTTIYEKIKAGEFRPARIGKRALILRSDLEDYLERNRAA